MSFIVFRLVNISLRDTLKMKFRADSGFIEEDECITYMYNPLQIVVHHYIIITWAMHDICRRYVCL